MTANRSIPLSIHAGLEALLGPAIMVAPFVFGFSEAAAVISVVVGAILLGLALQVPGPQRSLPLSYHADFDYALASFALAAGAALGFIAGDWAAASFLVGIGAVLVMLTASTRFSASYDSAN
jgi:predicted cation transporter